MVLNESIRQSFRNLFSSFTEDEISYVQGDFLGYFIDFLLFKTYIMKGGD